MVYRIIQATLITISLYGCAAPQLSLKQAASENIKSVEQVLVIPQENINTTIAKTNPGNTGLIGLLVAVAIDSSRQASANKHASPIIKKLENYDFRKTMLAQMKSKSAGLNYQVKNKLETVASESNKRIVFDEASMDAVLFTTVSYRIESKNLMITAVSEMYPKKKSLYPFRNKPSDSKPTDIGNIIYRKEFRFSAQGINASNITTNLSDGAASIAEQIAKDLSHPI
jgi:hypothetical protein